MISDILEGKKMRVFLKCSLFAFGFLLFSNVFGSVQQRETEGIYFCTKDVDRPVSLVSEKVMADYFNSDYFLPLDNVEESGEKHQIGRHCFMLHAKYMDTIIELDGTKKLSLNLFHAACRVSFEGKFENRRFSSVN